MRTTLGVLAALFATGCYGPEPTPGPTNPPAASPIPGKSLRAIEIAGGTLVVVGGGRYALASDPDLDRIWVVELTTSRVKGKIYLPSGSQPQRMIEDADGRVAVALRGTGKVATVSPVQMAVIGTVDACPEVRGLTLDKANKAVLAACAGGELVTIKNGTASITRPAPDLRDVVQAGGKTYVSTFRSAELIELDANGKPAKTITYPTIPLPPVDGKPTTFVPAVAWRTITAPGGEVVTVHHRTVDGDIGGIQVPAAPSPAYYQNTCESSIVRSTVSVVNDGQVVGSVDISGVLPVDVAVSPDNGEIAIAQPSSRFVQRVQMAAASAGVSGSACAPRGTTVPVGQVTGVAYTPQNDLIAHSRSPKAIWVMSKSGGQQQILLSADEVDNDGFQIFHDAVGAISCASCHPEGGEDGHVWTLFKQRVRTQTLVGGLTETAPFHWTGKLSSISDVMDETFVARMGGTEPKREVVTSLSGWLGGLPARKLSPTPTTAEIVDQGKALFESAATGCSSCHSGKLFTNNATVNVGTGAAFQVPSLRGVAQRGPWMHDGCAKTLKDRFGACGGDKHGTTSQLQPGEIDALVAYLETL